jgi:hypothetical protein
MLGPITQHATFQPNTYQLTMNAGEGGSATPPSGSYVYGTEVTITAFPDSKYAFLGWVGYGPGSYTGLQNPVTLTILGDIDQTASFGAPSPVTVTTNPEGLPVTVDGVETISPAMFNWAIGSEHSVSAEDTVPIETGRRYKFWLWSDALPRQHSIIVPPMPLLLTASYTIEHELVMTPVPEGTTSPESGWHPAGAVLQISGQGNPGFVFRDWDGAGEGSYTGPDNPATITLTEPVTQTPQFDPFGFELSISASATDPFVNVAAPSGGLRELHLWLTCAEEGLSAMQGETQGSLVPLAFTPADGVYNLGGANELLLAVGGCPAGESLAVRLGAWLVQDDGGTLCLDASSIETPFIAVECDLFAPSIAPNPRLVGFSSDGSTPCLIDDHPCQGSAPLSELAFTRGAGPGVLVPPALAVDAFRGIGPNPFSRETEIRFSLGTPRETSISIYDVSGRLVHRLADRELPAGEHRLAWNGRSSDGMILPPGVYFVQLRAGTFSFTDKVVRIQSP